MPWLPSFRNLCPERSEPQPLTFLPLSATTDYQSFWIIDSQTSTTSQSQIVTSPLISITHSHSHSPTKARLASQNLIPRQFGNNQDQNRHHDDHHHNHHHQGGGGGGVGGGAPHPSGSKKAGHWKRQTGEQLLLGVVADATGKCAEGLTACQVYGREGLFEVSVGPRVNYRRLLNESILRSIFVAGKKGYRASSRISEKTLTPFLGPFTVP